jgi:hypothetical protein
VRTKDNVVRVIQRRVKKDMRGRSHAEEGNGIRLRTSRNYEEEEMLKGQSMRYA